MSTSVNLSQTQKQTLRVAPQQIQFLNFLQLSTLELEQHLRNELEENPLLEEGATEKESNDEGEMEMSSDERDDHTADYETPTNVEDYRDWDEFSNDDIPEYKTRLSQDPNAEDDLYSSPIVEQETWREAIKEQIRWMNLKDRQRALAEFIIDSLDDDGFLRSDADALADDYSFGHGIFVDGSEVEEVIAAIHDELEPAGLAARDLRECLLLQLESRRATAATLRAMDIVSECFTELSNRNFEKICKHLSIDQDELRVAIAEIGKLNPKPIVGGNNDSVVVKRGIIPDYVLHYDDYGRIEVALNRGNWPDIRVNSSIIGLVDTSRERGAATYLKNKLQSAQWLVDAIRQRENTMHRAMRMLVELQRGFFETGDVRNLRPMILKDVADRIGMDISTISRVTSGKYVQTPFGLIHLKDLFTEGIRTEDGHEVSNKAIQQALVEHISCEDKRNPFNDFDLMRLLATQGYKISRRTVAKYRDQLGIQSAQFRRGV
ncbi:RNA polymerase sigma-54 factor [Siphonobacter sp. BAB-5405]|nr:RNA polymerase factor sigma-54 [Siphonobacter sp. BAB-5405]PMD96050.1 RNA polymerase sigma-54 factor [Siphonobacter sp. BAB-5405]